MLKRTTHQNRLYHELCNTLYRHKEVVVWDGRFRDNPIVFPPSVFTYDEFRQWIAELNLDYPRLDDGKPISSTKLSIEDMNSHIMFLEVLASEIN